MMRDIYIKVPWGSHEHISTLLKKIQLKGKQESLGKIPNPNDMMGKCIKLPFPAIFSQLRENKD